MDRGPGDASTSEGGDIAVLTNEDLTTSASGEGRTRQQRKDAWAFWLLGLVNNSGECNPDIQCLNFLVLF